MVGVGWENVQSHEERKEVSKWRETFVDGFLYGGRPWLETQKSWPWRAHLFEAWQTAANLTCRLNAGERL